VQPQSVWRWILLSASVLFTAINIRDAIIGKANAAAISRSNRDAVYNIERAITRTWLHSQKPRVITEPPTLDRLSQDTNIVTMTDHFISFPIVTEPFDWFFARERVDYVMLYNSPTYPKDRAKDDPFYQEVYRSAQLIRTEIGTIGDVGRDYFRPSPWEDTLLLFQLRK
jgi:hypothetical protein